MGLRAAEIYFFTAYLRRRHARTVPMPAEKKRNANYAIALLIASCPKEIWRRNILCELLIVEETG
jgi:hypothetical protein